MKKKSLIQVAALAGVISLLASCSSSNKFASSFEKRRYNKGYFVDFGTKSVNPKGNKTTVIANAVSNTSPQVATVIAAKANTANVTNKNVPSAVNAVPSMVIGKGAYRMSGNPKNVEMPKVEVKNQSKLPTIVATNDNHTSLSQAVTPPHGGGGSCKSWIVCLLLCWLLGFIGVHRFYMGYTWQGIVQLLTAGCCGIWTLIDFIRIIMKSLKPKGGDYCD